jgi:hypothetical protein
MALELLPGVNAKAEWRRFRLRLPARESAITCGLLGKYPPAEPGALALEPFEAADGGANAAPKFWAT